MNRLTEREHKALVDDIHSLDEQILCVGVFQYYPVGDHLFGEQKMGVTLQMVVDAEDNGKPFIDY